MTIEPLLNSNNGADIPAGRPAPSAMGWTRSLFIDEAEPDQALGEARTTMRDDILSRLLFEAGDFLDKIATGDCCLGPIREGLARG